MTKSGSEYGPQASDYKTKTAAIENIVKSEGDEAKIGQALLELGRLGAQNPRLSNKQKDALRISLQAAGVLTYRAELTAKDPEFIEKESDRVRWEMEMDGGLQFQAAITLGHLMQEGVSPADQMVHLKALFNAGHMAGMKRIDAPHHDDPTFNTAEEWIRDKENDTYIDLYMRAGKLAVQGVISDADLERLGAIEFLGDFREDPHYDEVMLHTFIWGNPVPPREYTLDRFRELQDVLYLGAARSVTDGRRAIQREEEMRHI